VDLKAARTARGWSQQETAMKLRVSQAYLSLLETGRRHPSPRLSARLARLFDLPATAVPVRTESRAMGPADLVATLASLGYAPFRHFSRDTALVNPAEVLFAALRAETLEPRVAEALPWLVYRYHDLDWNWLLPRAKANDLQNRLGFVVALAGRLAETRRETAKVQTLHSVEALLERSKLVHEDVFGRSALTNAESQWLREHRPEDARNWNVLSNLTVEHLHAF